MPRDGANADRGSGELQPGGAFQLLFESFPGAAIITDPGRGIVLDGNRIVCGEERSVARIGSRIERLV